MSDTIHIELSKAEMRRIELALSAKIDQLHDAVAEHQEAGRHKIAVDTATLTISYLNTQMRIAEAAKSAA